jgi:hypothetical protein
LILSAIPKWEGSILHQQELFDQEAFETLASVYPM